MSMAEPRRRKKWSLNPRGTLWANDDSKYGQKLMEKMGWSKGRGLGREEQGITEHLAVKFKDDSKGIGYKGSDDEWIKHYEDFENVLANLNSQENITVNSKSESNDDSTGPSDNNIGKISLESSSKASRVRVHYHKFTRGKDLSRCTEDDLGCILGSKRAKQLAKEKSVEGTVNCFEEVGHVDHSMGVTTIKGCSMQDYFAQKMEAFKNRAKGQPQTLAEENHCGAEEEVVERPLFGVNPGSGGNTPESPDDEKESRQQKKKKEKKRKKHQVETEEIYSLRIESENCCVEGEENSVPKKKKKIKRPDISDQTNGNACEDNAMRTSNEETAQSEPLIDEKTDRKKKKKDLGGGAEEQTLSEEHFVVKKKKKRKYTDTTNEASPSQLMIAEENPKKTKKNKKSKAMA